MYIISYEMEDDTAHWLVNAELLEKAIDKFVHHLQTRTSKDIVWMKVCLGNNNESEFELETVVPFESVRMLVVDDTPFVLNDTILALKQNGYLSKNGKKGVQDKTFISNFRCRRLPKVSVYEVGP